LVRRGRGLFRSILEAGRSASNFENGPRVFLCSPRGRVPRSHCISARLSTHTRGSWAAATTMLEHKYYKYLLRSLADGTYGRVAVDDFQLVVRGESTSTSPYFHGGLQNATVHGTLCFVSTTTAMHEREPLPHRPSRSFGGISSSWQHSPYARLLFLSRL
jgi:hypothetical protein